MLRRGTMPRSIQLPALCAGILFLTLLSTHAPGAEGSNLRAENVAWSWNFILDPLFTEMFGQVCHIYTNTTTGHPQMLIYSGYHATPKGPSNDMYRYDFATKELLGVIQHAAPGGSLPWKRDGATAILNTEKTILMIFGGSQAPAEALDDTWELDIATATWVEYTAGVALGPSRRYGTSIVYVPILNCALMFGGSFWLERIYHNDLWCYSFVNHYWRGIEPVAGDVPPARFGHTAAYYDQYMYVYGGGDNGVDFNDLWVFDPLHRVWGQVMGSTLPGRAWMQSTIIDGHWVVIGGARNSTDTMEVWRWPFSPTSSLGYWEQVEMSGAKLSGRMDSCVVNLANTSSVYMLGGFSYEQRGPVSDFVYFKYDPLEVVDGK